MDNRLVNLLRALNLAEDEQSSVPYVEEYVEEQLEEQVSKEIIEEVPEDKTIEDIVYSVNEDKDIDIEKEQGIDITHADVGLPVEVTPPVPDISLVVGAVSSEEVLPEHSISEDVFNRPPVTDKVDDTDIESNEKVEDPVIHNKEILLLKMMNMGFVVNNRRLNTGGLYDFRYENAEDLGIDVSKLLDDSFFIDDITENEVEDKNKIEMPIKNKKGSILRNLFGKKEK